MIFAVDVYYRSTTAIAAGVLFANWEDREPVSTFTTEITDIAEYEPGQFYKRELPCLLKLLEQLDRLPEYIIVDGYVYLDKDYRPGLGKYLHDAIDGKSIVIGVAKTKFQDIPNETEVRRNGSNKPLFVTAVGMDETEARSSIKGMSGTYRIPIMLKLVDDLSKGAAS